MRATREQEGLPAAGGIAGSRAASLKDAEGVLGKKSVEEARPETTLAQAQQDRAASAAATAPTETAKETQVTTDNAQVNKEYYGETSPDGKSDGLQKTNTAASTIADPKQQDHRATVEDDDEDDDDPIRTAAPPEMLAAPGDTCAICLDSLEDDDDVRGLTCGHAFHAACVDPWLTGRRACCPLCKADYYVPKPRPEGEAGQEEQSGRRSAGIGGLRINMPGVPPPTRYGFGRSRIYMLSSSQHDPNQPGRGQYQSRHREHGDSWFDRLAGFNRRPATQSNAPATDPTPVAPQTAHSNNRWPSWMPHFHRPGPRQPSQADATTAQPTVTPSALEAGRT